MKHIGILTRGDTLYSTRRLRESAKKLGYEASIIDPNQCTIILDDKPKLNYKGRELNHVDVIVPRVGVVGMEFSTYVLQQFELMNTPVLNSSSSISLSKDKFRCLQILSMNGIPCPMTMMMKTPMFLDDAIEKIGGTPAILKFLRGSQGIGVMLGESKASILSIMESLWALGYDIMLQEFVRESEGEDIRVLVVGENVLGAMRRIAGEGDFRSNIHRGGIGTAVKVSKEIRNIALKVCKIAGLRFAGVDLMLTKSGALVLEINSSPGFYGFEKATKKDVAIEIINTAIDLI